MVNQHWLDWRPYGVGERYPIPVTRKIIRAVQSGAMNKAPFEADPIFNLQIPVAVDGIDTETLHPNKSWTSQDEYQSKAQSLAGSFHEQMKTFGEFYEKISSAGPNQ